MDASTWDAGRQALAEMVVGDALGDIPAGMQAGVLVLMLGSARWARSGGRARVVALVLCCLMWSRANHAFEGAVLWSFGPEHGLTVSDLLPPLLAGWVAIGRSPGHPASSPIPVRHDRTALTLGEAPPFGPSLGVALCDRTAG